jgi:hypothetical protein
MREKLSMFSSAAYGDKEDQGAQTFSCGDRREGDPHTVKSGTSRDRPQRVVASAPPSVVVVPGVEAKAQEEYAVIPRRTYRNADSWRELNSMRRV